MTTNCSPTLVSKCQDCRPTGHHRFGFLSRRHRLDKHGPVSTQVLTPIGRTTLPLYQTLFQLVGNFHFPAEQSANIGPSKSSNLSKFTCSVALDQNSNNKNCTRDLDPPTHQKQCKFVRLTPLRSVRHQKTKTVNKCRQIFRHLVQWVQVAPPIKLRHAATAHCEGPHSGRNWESSPNGNAL